MMMMIISYQSCFDLHVDVPAHPFATLSQNRRAQENLGTRSITASQQAIQFVHAVHGGEGSCIVQLLDGRRPGIARKQGCGDGQLGLVVVSDLYKSCQVTFSCNGGEKNGGISRYFRSIILSPSTDRDRNGGCMR